MPTALAVRSSARVDVPAAVSTAVEPLLRTPTTGTVLACFPAAVYVRLRSGAVIALVTSDGLRLPNALVVAAASRRRPFDEHGTVSGAAVADGVLVLDGVRYRPVRTWTPRERTAGDLSPAVVAALEERLRAAPPPHRGESARRLRTGTARLATALRCGTGLGGAADDLLGLGPGLTPAGDDVLGGVLVTCAHLAAGAPVLAAAVRRRAGATTALSADLLGHAAEGRAAPPVLGLLDALVGARPLGPALADLLAVGASSGHDTATGVLLAARVLLDRRSGA